MKYANGDVYEGEWQNGAMHGKGELTFHNGREYVGEFKNDKYDGFGKLIWQDGSYYLGWFKNGNFNGKGTYLFSNGSIYEGQWLDDKRHGYGKMQFVDGDVYEGEYQNDMRHGKGTYTYADGDKYSGQWFNNQKHGKGKFIYVDGDVYEGGWKNDEKHGKGVYFYASGKQEYVEYDNGKLIVDEAKKLREKGVEAYNEEHYHTAKDYFCKAYDIAEDYELKEQLKEDIDDCDYCILREEAYEEYNKGVNYYRTNWEQYAIDCFKNAKRIFGHLEPSFARECDEYIAICEDALYDDEEDL